MTGTRTVLVVEDDYLVRVAAAIFVEDAGYSALQAEGAEEALRILEANEVDIVFTDILLAGGADGVSLCAQIQERWPQIALLVTSGRKPDDELPFCRNSMFVLKPYGAAVVKGAWRC